MPMEECLRRTDAPPFSVEIDEDVPGDAPHPGSQRFKALPFLGVDNLKTQAVVFDAPGEMRLMPLALRQPQADEIIVDTEYSGISTGTERLFWTGEMPPFPGMAYPLVPGYESVGRVIWADEARDLIGQRVFVPGASCYVGASGLFGASANRLVVKKSRVTPITFSDPAEGVLLALAATAHHALVGGQLPDLIIGHGVLGRLLARLTLALGGQPPVVWEIDPLRSDADGYPVIDPAVDGRTDYQSIYDVSGDAQLMNELIGRLCVGGEITLAGFYKSDISFAFAPAFMKEAKLRIAAEWQQSDMDAVIGLIDRAALDLSGLITHHAQPDEAANAYDTAFHDPSCLKMILDWRAHA